jgi:hypothetical protein
MSKKVSVPLPSLSPTTIDSNGPSQMESDAVTSLPSGMSHLPQESGLMLSLSQELMLKRFFSLQWRLAEIVIEVVDSENGERAVSISRSHFDFMMTSNGLSKCL